MASSSSSSSPEITNSMRSNTSDNFHFRYNTQEEVLEDLSSRFILNLPDEELSSVERICFQIEQAHWYYEDFVREENPKFPSLSLKKFSAMLFQSCPLLTQWGYDHEEAFNTFMQYKTRVPVCGAIMLNDTLDKCVLVKGWKSSSGWGFPKGKINQAEEPHRCAIREVLEETGYDLTDQIQLDDLVELTIKEQRITLYIVGGVPEDFQFQTKTRKEISKIEWFRLSDLPTWKRNKAVVGKFYLISPFVPALKSFVNSRKSVDVSRSMTLLSSGINHLTLITQDIEEEENPGLEDDTFVSYNRIAGTEGASSQSSSATNGDPQTPSPQYSVNFPISIKEDDVVNDLSFEEMDPHFARLLSALAVSSSRTNLPDAEALILSTPIPAPSESTPIVSTAQYSPLSKSDKVKDVPPERPQSSSAFSKNQSKDLVPQSSDMNTLTSSPSLPLIGNANAQSNVLQQSSSAGGIHTQRPTQVYSNDRITKQLALLEALTSETSRRSTPIAHSRNAEATNKFGFSGYHAQPPYPSSSSVPPMPVMGNPSMQMVPYTFQANGQMPISHPLVVQQQQFSQHFYDSSSFRPSTSNAVFNSSTSMSLYPRPPPEHAQFVERNLPIMHYQPPPPGPPYSLPPQPQSHAMNGMGPQPLRVMLPPASAMREPGPLTAPPTSPGFFTFPNSSQVSNRLDLLSILNSNNHIATDAKQPNYSSGGHARNLSSNGVSNGIAHR